MEVRSVIQQIAVEHRRRYGYRRISAELRRRGMRVNHKRVLRIIREDNLLAVQPRAFVVTTDSDHEFEVYLNLAGRMKLTGMNQPEAASDADLVVTNIWRAEYPPASRVKLVQSIATGIELIDLAPAVPGHNLQRLRARDRDRRIHPDGHVGLEPPLQGNRG